MFVVKLVLPRDSWTLILLDGLGVSEGHMPQTQHSQGGKGTGVFKPQPLSDGLGPLGPEVRVGREDSS